MLFASYAFIACIRALRLQSALAFEAFLLHELPSVQNSVDVRLLSGIVAIHSFHTKTDSDTAVYSCGST